MGKREVKISRNEYGLSTNPVHITPRQHLPLRSNLDRTTESIINYQSGIIGATHLTLAGDDEITSRFVRLITFASTNDWLC